MVPKICLVAVIFTSVLIVSSCGPSTSNKKTTETSVILSDSVAVDSIIEKEIKLDSSKIAFGFDFPVGKPDAKGYYNYQKFTENNHLGEDWNGQYGGNSDLGDTIYSIANGQVTYAKDFGGGWGNTIRIVHELPNGSSYESVYAHCDTVLTMANAWVLKGEPIGTIGTAHDQYYAHLHLEIRNKIGMPIGNGYSADTTGYVNPTTFIKKNRQIRNQMDSTTTRN